MTRSGRCVGCGGLVPDEDGPIHRYMTASPGCWRIHGELMAGDLPATALARLAVDAYAVTHPGRPGPQSTPSVWIHLITLCAVLERSWPVEQAVRLRRAAADAFAAWPWLVPPVSMGRVTAVDVAAAVANDLPAGSDSVDRWVTEAWRAWDAHGTDVRGRLDDLTRHFFD
jgi:Family of unknown function (DUF5946)